MRVMFVAGGTGGHINPAIAVAKEMKTYDQWLEDRKLLSLK